MPRGNSLAGESKSRDILKVGKANLLISREYVN